MTTRKQIRDTIKTTIEGLSGNSGKVYAYQRKVIETSGHAIAVFMTDGERSHAVGYIQTAAELTVSIMTPATTDIDDAIDTISTPIEAAIDADKTLGGIVSSCRLSGWSYQRNQDDAMTGINLSYSITYQ